MTSSRIAQTIRALAAALAAASAAHATLWVSSGGDDNNPGTEEQPLRTIARARDVVRTLNHDMADDITVFIGGEHHFDRPLELGPEDSGTNGFNIVYTAAPGEHPVISGAFRVTGWTLAGGTPNLWWAPAPAGLEDTHSLFVNGTPASRTRGRLLQVFSTNPAGAPVATPDPRAQWKNPGDVVFERPGPDAIWSERAETAPLFVENAFELLGKPGEWYFDRPAGRIYYTPRAGEEMATADVEAAAAGAFIIGRGSKERPIAGLIFKGIRFEYTTWPNSQEPGLKGPGAFPGAAVSFAFAEAVQFAEDEFLHMGTPALELGPGVGGGTIDGCVFGDISWSALRISGASRVQVAESRISYAATAHVEEGAIDLDHSEDVSIENNQIDHFPSVAILATGEQPGAVREEANLISPPMIGYHGKHPEMSLQPPAAGAGIPAAYRALLDVKFGSPTTPRPPTQVAAEAGDKFAYVTWIPSCLDGGSPVTAYTVTASTGPATVVSAGDFQEKGYVVIGGLENGHSVTFTVSAANGLGSSPPSPPTANVTPQHKRKLKPPPAPATVSVTAGKSETRVQITPSGAGTGGPVIAYSIAAAPAGPQVLLEGLDVIHSDVAHPLSRTIANFPLDSATTVSVAAKNAAGAGKPTVVKLQH